MFKTAAGICFSPVTVLMCKQPFECLSYYQQVRNEMIRALDVILHQNDEMVARSASTEFFRAIGRFPTTDPTHIGLPQHITWRDTFAKGFNLLHRERAGRQPPSTEEIRAVRAELTFSKEP